MLLASKKFFRPAFLFVIFVVSAGLIGYALWLYQVEQGNRAYQAGDLRLAGEIYDKAELPFSSVPWLTYLLREDFQTLVFNGVAALHAGAKDAEALEKLQQGVDWAPFLTETGEYSFWLGNLLFRRAASSKKPEDLLNHLKAALAEYQKGLQASPENWDLKYNYELVRLVFSQRDQGPKQQQEKVKSIIEKMRPVTDPSKDELPPEKRG